MIPPRSIETERAVLSAMLLENKPTIDDVCEIVDSSDFFDPRHVVLFDTITMLFDRDGGVDFLSLKGELEAKCDGRKKIELAGGALYLSDVLDSAKHSALAIKHAREVKELAKLRRILELSANCQQWVEEKRTSEEIQADIDAMLMGVDKGEVEEWTGLEAYEAMEDFRKARDGDAGLYDTHLTEINSIYGGWRTSQMVVVGARPACGKTTLTMNLALRWAIRGHEVGFFSLEMSREEMRKKFLAMLARVDSDRANRGELEPWEFEKLGEMADKFNQLPIHLCFEPYLTPSSMRRKARKLLRKHDIKIWIVDYLQLMTPQDTSKRSRQEVVSEFSRSFKLLMKEVDGLGIAVCQLRRREGENPKPKLSDLRESGAIEQDADSVFMIWRNGDESIILIRKNRHGPEDHKGKAVTFVGNEGRFKDYDPGFVSGNGWNVPIPDYKPEGK